MHGNLRTSGRGIGGQYLRELDFEKFPFVANSGASKGFLAALKFD
jgi:hypothetical protein